MEKKSLKHLEEELRHCEGLYQQFMQEARSSRGGSIQQMFALKKGQLTKRKIDHINRQIADLGTHDLLVQVKGVYLESKIINNQEIAFPKEFTLYYTGITLEDAKAIVEKNFKNSLIKTIDFQNIPTGVIHFK